VLGGATVGCGGGLMPRIETAMDGCLAARRPAFQRGEQVAQIGTALPDSAERAARLLNYDAAARQLEGIAESAPDQVTLVCSLEVMRHNTGDRTTLFLKRYTRHPNTEVAQWATALLAGRRGAAGAPRTAVSPAPVAAPVGVTPAP
jgi:hypothetical protein